MDMSRLGMGCGPIGNLYRAMRDEDATAVVESALRAGIRHFDVAPHYGFGLAERRLGAALARHPEVPVTISTKVGRLLRPTAAGGERHGFVDADPFEPVFDYRGDAILASHRSSLERLRRERVDLLLAHDLGTLTHGEDADRHFRDFVRSGYPAMRALKAEGRIDAVGIGVNEIAVCEQLLDHVELDVILLAGRYTLLEQAALPLLDRCAREGVGVIVGGPYNSGLLVEAPGDGPVHYDYAEAPSSVLARAQALRARCAAHGTPLPAAALRFPLAHPAVSRVVVGLGATAHVAATADWSAAPIPDALWRDLREAGLLSAEVPVP